MDYQDLLVMIKKSYALVLKVFGLSPLVAAGAIIEDKGKILLVKNKDGYSLPGGVVKYGEDLYQAVKREAEEETGIRIKVTGLVGIYSNPKDDPYVCRVGVVYKAKKIGGNLRSSNEGQALWIAKNKMPRLVYGLHKAMDDYKRKRTSIY